MKKYLSVILVLFLLCALITGCQSNETGGKNTPTPQKNASVGDTAQNKSRVDLTKLSSTMVYAEVYNIMMEPDSYVGKTIKGQGLYNAFHDEENDKYYHYFIVSDATGCCPQGLDFVWKGEHMYPDDYPQIGESIEVEGVFTKGEAMGQGYYYLEVDDISGLNF